MRHVKQVVYMEGEIVKRENYDHDAYDVTHRDNRVVVTRLEDDMMVAIFNWFYVVLIGEDWVY